MAKLAELELTGDLSSGVTVNLTIYKTDQPNADKDAGKSGALRNHQNIDIRKLIAFFVFLILLKKGLYKFFPLLLLPLIIPSRKNLDQFYENWLNAYINYLDIAYRGKHLALRRRENIANIAFDENEFKREKQQSYQKYVQTETALLENFHEWLNDSEFSIIKETLKNYLNSNDVNRILIKTDNYRLRRLPWQKWDLLIDYPYTEIGISSPNFRSVSSQNISKDKVRILVILGKDANIQTEIEELKTLGSYLEVQCICPQDVLQLDQPLWKKNWDILLFNGHSKSNETATDATIQLDEETRIPISLLRNHLQKAIENGLKLAIFNSCDGLGIAYQLAEGGELHLPQVMVMRELLPVDIAPLFLRYFLEAFTQGNSLYKSVREARDRLQLLEQNYPAASWLPIICQNPAESPLKWHELAPTSFCPYRGLLAFQAEDERFFFGRNEFTNKLVKAVKKETLVAVIGASGSGKSSVVFAGLIPQLKREGGWLIQSFRPGKSPFESLAIALLSLGLDFPSLGYRKGDNEDSIIINEFEVTKQSAIQELTRQLKNNHQIILQIINDIYQQGQLTQTFDKLLLVTDQFEELYTLEDDKQEAQKFLDCILNAVENAPNFKFVLTLRADFYGYALSYLTFGEVLQNARLDLLPMRENDLQQVIVAPAQMYGVELEEGLKERILEKIESKNIKDQRDNLPLLEFTLTQLWRKQGRGGLLTNQVYDEIGGIEQALANHAEEIYSQINTEERKQLQQIFVQLIRPGEGTDDTRRIATRREIKEENWPLVVYLNQENVRLVVVGYDEASKQETVEVVHEVLIRGWGRLNQWMQKDREFRLWQEGLRGVVNKWENKDKDEGFLWRGKALVEGEDWLQQRSEEISDFEQDFIKLSVGLREREAKAKKQRQQRTIWGLTSGLFAVTVFAVGAVWQWQQAEFQREEAEKQRIDAELTASSLSSENLFNSNKELEALIEAIKAGKILQKSGTVKADTRMRVLLALQQTVYEIRERNRLEEQTNTLSGISFSPNGKMFASSHYGVIKIWDRDGNLLRTIKVEGVSGKLSFSPDSKMIVTSVSKTDYSKLNQNNSFSSSSIYELQTWSTDGILQKTLKGHSDFITNVIFAPSNQLIASTSIDKTVKLWSLDGDLIHILKHTNEVRNISFSPDGKVIASEDGKDIKLWNVENGKLIKILKGHTHKIEWVSFSPDGKMIASYDDNNFKNKYKNLKIWKSDGSLIKSLKIISHSFSFPKFTPDSKSIAAFDLGRTNDINLWGLDGKLISTFNGNSAMPVELSFSPDGQFLATANAVGKITVWSLNKVLPTIIRTPKITVNAISFSPDSKIIALANQDNKVRLWNRDSKSFQILQGHQHPVKGIAFSPVGDNIASISKGGEAIVWDYHGTVLNKFDVTDYNIKYEDHDDGVSSVKFVPGQNQVASVSFDGTLRFWSLDGQYGTLLDASGVKFPIWDISFSPNGKTFAFAIMGNAIYLFKDGQSKAQILIDNNKGLPIRSISFSPDGKILASASFDKTVKLWNLEGKQIQTLNHNNAVGSVSFSPDGQTIATISGDGIKLWNLSGQLLRQFNSSQIPDAESFGIGINSLELDKKTSYPIETGIIIGSPAQKAGIKEGDKIVKINGIDVKGKKLTDVKRLIKGKEGTKVTLEISRPYQSNFSVSMIRERNETYEKKVQFSPDGQIIAAINNDKIEIWDTTGKLLKTLSGHTDAIFDINFSPNGKNLATASVDKTVKLWSIPEGREIKTLNGHGAAVTSVSFSADNQFLVSSSADSTIRVWKADGTFIKPLLGKPRIYNNPVPSHVSFSQDGKMLALSGKLINHGSLWTINGNLVKNLSYSGLQRFLPDGNLGFWQGISDGHKNFVTSMIYSPDGKMIVSGSGSGLSKSDTEIKIWTQDGIFIRDLKGGKLSINDLSFSPDSKTVASANLDNTLKLWSIDGTLLKTLTANNTPIYSVAFSPVFSDNNYILASGSTDKMGTDSINNTVQIWSSNGTLLKSLKGYNCGIIEGGQGCLSFSPDGKTLASVNNDSVILWNLDVDDLLIKGCNWVEGYLKSNPNVSESDKHLCDDIDTTK